MPTILTNDLRSPDERRSDQLTILKRRPPPPRSAGRFCKILADTTSAIGAFDPAFDSDAETDGPASGSGIWRRELSRVRSASSTSIGLLVDERRIPSFDNKLKLRSDERAFERVTSRNDSEDSFVFQGFLRDRTTSFYGKDNDIVEVIGEGMSAICEEMLKQELQEDYDKFYHGNAKENESRNEEESVKEDKRATKSDLNDSTNSEESEKAVRSLESAQSESLRRLKRIRLNDEPDRFTVSIVSEDNSDDELEQVSAMVPYPFQGGSIPLFVEEIGRVPRAVIIDGKVTRVRVSPDRGSFREAVSRARRSSFGWGLGKDGWLRRRSVGFRRKGSGWWRVKRLLFRNGMSEADAAQV